MEHLPRSREIPDNFEQEQVKELQHGINAARELFFSLDRRYGDDPFAQSLNMVLLAGLIAKANRESNIFNEPTERRVMGAPAGLASLATLERLYEAGNAAEAARQTTSLENPNHLFFNNLLVVSRKSQASFRRQIAHVANLKYDLHVRRQRVQDRKAMVEFDIMLRTTAEKRFVRICAPYANTDHRPSRDIISDEIFWEYCGDLSLRAPGQFSAWQARQLSHRPAVIDLRDSGQQPDA